jgi:hypothetical protein
MTGKPQAEAGNVPGSAAAMEEHEHEPLVKFLISQVSYLKVGHCSHCTDSIVKVCGRD